jgi:demethylmenaquinone methyltransferase/2-methoxy-6-polyprenyl-1,4-benzoquinol methylase
MNYKVESIAPYNGNERKSVQVERMFNTIAGNYDKLNHTLSVGIDRSWRKKGVLALKDMAPRTMLDVATGTGDLSILACRLLHPDSIKAVDISEEMMNIGREKVGEAGLSDCISFEKQDCTQLPYSDNSFDAAMVSFGLRNFEDLDKGLSEIRRVLKPGGRLIALELSTPGYFPVKQGYWLYSKLIIPVIGKLISNDNTAYTYLPQSVKAFPQGREMTAILEKNGYRKASCETFTFGICSMYMGEK